MAKPMPKNEDAVPDSIIAEASSPSEAESRVAQWLLDAGRERPKPPRLKMSKDKGGVQIEFEGDNRRALLAMHSVSGMRNADAANLLVDQLAKLTASDLERESVAQVNSAIAMMDEIQPSDGPEAMLAAQMVAVHFASMQCFSRALLSDQTFAGRELNLKHGAKLSRIYAQQVEALDRHRRKGQQTVVVEHVHVNDGGQAIVGNVSAGRGV